MTQTEFARANSAACQEPPEDQGPDSAPRSKSFRLSRRTFLSLSAAGLGGLALYAGEISRHELSVEEHTIHLPRLPDPFRGMRVVQISDLHYAEFTEPFFLREVVRQVNRLRPDMVLITGDFISYGPMPISFSRRHVPECAEILAGIECPLRYAILGNHDCLIGADYVIGPVEERGIPMLVNRTIALERDGKRLWLAGLGSVSCGLSRPEKAISPSLIRSGEALIVMAHEPDILPEIAKYKADLMLSGHTHGGQVRIPFLPLFNLPAYGRRYIEGQFQLGPTQLYVNRGIGAVGVPFRFRCPPEITVHKLA